MEIFVDFTKYVLQLNKLVQKIKLNEIEKCGLKPVHVMCGYYLYHNPQGLTAKELAEMTLEDKAAISRALKTMRENGLVAYNSKGRNANVTLTEEGEKFGGYISERVNAAVKAVSVDFTDGERQFFYKSLSLIVENLKTYYNRINQNHPG